MPPVWDMMAKKPRTSRTAPDLSPVRDTTALPLEEAADLGLGARMT